MGNKSDIKSRLVMAVFLFGLGCTTAAGDIIYVDANGSADFETIQEAIDNSNNGDEIVVAEATYVENINFVGKNIILRSTDPNNSAVVAATIIDGNDANSVVTFSGTEDSNCVLTGFTITGGKKGMPLYVDIQDISGDVEPNWIGLDEDELPIILSADFDDNFSATLEYGLLLDNGDWQTEYPPGPDIADVLEDGYRRNQDGDIITLTFSNLKAGDYSIVTYHVDMDNNSGTEGTFKVFVDGQVAFNYAATVGRDSPLGPDGTAWFGFTSDGVNDVVIEFDGEAVEPDVDEVWLNGFSLEGEGPLCRGGGIAGNGCSATISKCVITENWANEGGGVYDCDGMIENNVIVDNVADEIRPPYGPIGGIGNGGGLSGCDGTIARNKISGNYAFAGGGLLNCDGTVINNLLVGNFAVYGGAFYDCDGTIINCTVVGHSLDGLEDCNGTITNCIIWHNLNQLDDCNVPSYSCIEDWGGGGIGNISTDPCFADPCNGDYHLQPVSPCIDAGDDTAVPSGVTTDLDGRPRFVDGDCNDTIVIDMGTYEFGWVYLGDFDGQCDVDFGDFAIFASAFLSEPGDGNWNTVCDISLPADFYIDWRDLDVFTDNWLAVGSIIEPSIAYEITPCDLGLLAAEQSSQTRFTVTVEGRYIHFEDMMVANCCPDELWLEMTVEDNLITIYEIEYTPGGCYCICDYPVTATFGPFEPGTYTLEVYEDWGGFIGSTTVTID